MAKKSVEIEKEDISIDDLKIVKTKKTKKDPEEGKDPRKVFEKHIETLNIENMKKPWMNNKRFRLITSISELEEWIEVVFRNVDLYAEVPRTGERIPAVAVDTETNGLDTRIIDVDGYPKLMMDIAGICLSHDGYEGIYIPITHEDGNNIDREACRKVLQDFFNRVLLVFYNAKYDREVLRVFMGISFRDYPYFEDVQVIQYLKDPKAKLDDSKKSGAADGLKAASKAGLGIEQIELDELVKIKVKILNEKGKWSWRQFHCPFSWVPTPIALWYAAGDAICTWLLWQKDRDEARAMKAAHKLDHEMVDSISWVERQRFHIDREKLEKLTKWQKQKLLDMEYELKELSGYTGEEKEAFSPTSNPDLAKLFFEVKKFKPYKKSELTGAPSVDIESLQELEKEHPDDLFLKKLMEYRSYVSLHPENLRFEPLDGTARINLKQCVVAGGRLAASGGDYMKDGGFGLNIQAIKRVEGNWWVYGRKWIHDGPVDTIEYPDTSHLHPKCLKKNDKGGVDVAPNIWANHYGKYFGEYYCMVPECKDCPVGDNKLVRVDANEIINLRSLFCVQDSNWTFFTTDYSNIEMRVAANISGEPAFIKEFLEGSGDFHSLTASLIFPEFNSKEIAKDKKKELRSLAKIINFSLLYGGTSYTIYESMKKVRPDITREECEQMVDAYWVGVPTFDSWVKGKQKEAREKLICKTPMGRIIKFQSLMDSYKISIPTERDKANYSAYWELRNAADRFRAQGEKKEKESGKEAAEKFYKEASKSQAAADALYFERSTGVRNMQEYKRFLGKIQRVSMNIPLQGLAGDFMRASLNRIMRMVHESPEFEAVVQLHGSVHDEIDYTVHNLYVPFVVPRLTRKMKLRDIHEAKNWTVPIECDTEYGSSWDVSEHLTGDDSHEPAGWTEIKGMEEYVPYIDESNFNKLLNGLMNPSLAEKRLNYLESNLNPRIAPAINALKKALSSGDRDLIRKKLIVCFQLAEYWDIDQTPEGEDDKMETITQYEERVGIDPSMRPRLPVGGRLGILEQFEIVTKEDPTKFVESEKENIEEIKPNQEETKIETPKKSKTIVELRDDLTEEEYKELEQFLGIGSKKVSIIHQGKTIKFTNVFTDNIPDRFIKNV